MLQVDCFPTHSIQNLKYRAGRVFPFGATILGNAVNFSIFSKEATSCSLVLFRHGEREPFVEIPFPAEFRIGNVYAMMVFDLDIETTEYGYRFDGPHDPARGLYYDRTKILLDPYARSITGRSVWGVEPDLTDPFPHRGQIIREDYDWEGDKPLELCPGDLVIYEMHIRSLTMHPSSKVKHPGTYAGLIEKIPYLKQLGINCVELMPVFEFDEFEYSDGQKERRRLNYWGYSTIGFFAPKAGYAASAPYALEVDEFKNMIRSLHRSGIEVILDVVFNHTAEGGEGGRYISYRGIDNRTYYLLDEQGRYVNYSGCGNTMNCNNAVVRNSILDALRYWVSSCHIDGFRFDLASILSRDENGDPMPSPPILETIAHDPVLGKCKLIAEAWDAGGLYQVGSFPSWNRWAEWNGKYRDTLRSLLKGNADAAPAMYRCIRGSDDLYGPRGAEASINFVTCHDGFTLHDLVSYNEKHNLENGEDNRDGSNDNNSWNCGAEGDTDDEQILALRERQMRNAFTILLTSRGIPMILSGDEFANTQFGNNNAYCQDNDISYLNWEDLKKHGSLFTYVRNLIALRRAHPILRSASYDFSHNDTGYPELSFHSCEPWNLDEQAPNLTFAFLYAEGKSKYGMEKDTFLYILVNMHWEPHAFRLPIIPEGRRWHLACDSSGLSFAPGQEQPLENADSYPLEARTCAVLVTR